MQLGQSENVRGHVTGESGQASGEVADFSLNGGAVRIPIAEDPSFFIGESVNFRIDSKMGRGSLLASVRSRTELEGSRRFGLTFAADTLGSQFSRDLIRHFDKLRQNRVEPQKAVRVELRARGQDIRATGQMRNVSPNGMAVVMNAQDERSLARVVDVDLQFRLPGSDQRFVLRSAIRHRNEDIDGDGIRIGLSFDPRTPAFNVQQQDIADYVVNRQTDVSSEQMR